MEEVKQALHQAYTGEAKAALRLKVYAEKAREEGYPQLARLFEVISFSEELHGRRALRLLKEVRETQENLSDSFESETKVAGVAYDEFIKLAEKVGKLPTTCARPAVTLLMGFCPRSVPSAGPRKSNFPHSTNISERIRRTYS
jgi:rubrerythrin